MGRGFLYTTSPLWDGSVAVVVVQNFDDVVFGGCRFESGSDLKRRGLGSVLDLAARFGDHQHAGGDVAREGRNLAALEMLRSGTTSFIEAGGFTAIDEAAEGLVDAGDAGNLIHAAEGLLAGEAGDGFEALVDIGAVAPHIGAHQP